MSRRSTPGRRRAPKQAWYAEFRGVLRPAIIVKSAAALGLVGATTAAVLVPAAPGASAAAQSPSAPTAASAATVQPRLTAFASVSRGTQRIALPSTGTATVGVTASPAASSVVTAPTAGPVTPGQVGITGVSAVAKPAVEVNLDAAGAGGTANSSGATGYSATAFLGICRGLGLGNNAAGVCSAVRSLFGPLTIGGYRAGDPGDHGSGHAADIMVDNFGEGDAIAAFLQDHAGELDIKYLIWRQRYWAPGGSWRLMADRGSPTENHMDHVHVSVN